MRVFEIKTVRLLLLMWVLGSITVALQAYVGHATLYSEELQDRREELQYAILSKQGTSGGNWDNVGPLYRSNIRIGAVYAAVHTVTRLSLVRFIC